MSISGSRPRTTPVGSSRRLIVAIAIAALIAIAVWAIASRLVGQPVRHATAKDTSVLRSLTPEQQRYVRAISSLSYEQLAAAFGTGR